MSELWFSAQELAGQPGMPITSRGVKKRSAGWKCRPRKGRGGGLEYSYDSLPKETQQALVAAAVKVACSKDIPVKIKPVRLIYEVVIGGSDD